MEWLGQSHSGTRVFSGMDMTSQAMAWEMVGQGRKYTNSRPKKVQILPFHCVTWRKSWTFSEPNHLSVQVYVCYCITTKSCQETNFFLLKMISKTQIGMKNTASVILFHMPTEHSIWSAASEWKAGWGLQIRIHRGTSPRWGVK